jgi:hypothetical protein
MSTHAARVGLHEPSSAAKRLRHHSHSARALTEDEADRERPWNHLGLLHHEVTATARASPHIERDVADGRRELALPCGINRPAVARGLLQQNST